MPTTYPNQRMVRIHREHIETDFLGIKNENWMAASKTLGAHALRLYLYLAANANNYMLALSPAALERDIGMPRSTYHDQFRRLINFGYIVQSGGNLYEFYEVPKDESRMKKSISSDGCDCSSSRYSKTAEDTEINNINIINNSTKIQGQNAPVTKEFVF